MFQNVLYYFKNSLKYKPIIIQTFYLIAIYNDFIAYKLKSNSTIKFLIILLNRNNNIQRQCATMR